MNRRKFGLMAGSSIAASAAAVAAKPAFAQAAPDASLLTTTLTPYGAIRAGNADGSIPAWTGGNVAPATTPTQVIDVPFMPDEASIYTVDGSNLAQYSALVTPGLQALITKYGFSMRVFPTYRTAAAPQYVYDNIAKNVTRAQLDPKGGRFGFVGGYGGIPFPIINTADPFVGGAQIIWNHLTHWEGYSNYTTFSPAFVVTNGVFILTNGQYSRFEYPYYDPNGTAEAYAGYYSKLHIVAKAPAAVVGQETLVWHSTNVTIKPDITWTLLNGQGRVRKAPDESYDTPNPQYNGISNIDESQGFYGNPSEYDWKYISKSEMLVPYNNNAVHTHDATQLAGPKFPNPELMRWEKHRVWVVEATLHPGSRNVLARRRFYADEDTGQILAGEAYDHDGNMTRLYMNPVRTVPSVPMVNPAYIVVLSLITGDYVINGNLSFGAYHSNEYSIVLPSSAFDAEQMAASAAF